MTTARFMTLNRNFTLCSVYGHTIRFEKGLSTFVPPALYSEALAIGAAFDDGEALPVNPEAENKAPSDPGARAAAVLAAVQALITRNAADDFTAAGVPKVDAVSLKAEFKVSGKEIATAWQTHHDGKAAEADAG